MNAIIQPLKKNVIELSELITNIDFRYWRKLHRRGSVGYIFRLNQFVAMKQSEIDRKQIICDDDNFHKNAPVAILR